MVREYVAYLRVEKGMRPATCEAYACDLDQFAEQLEERDALLATAVEADVSGFMAHLRGNQVDARSIARKLSCLRGFYRWLLLDKRIDHDPTVAIGLTAARPISSGAVITNQYLLAAKAVQRGQTVTLVADSGSMSIRMEGKALSDALINQRVKVQNLSSGKVVEGVARSEQVVEIVLQ